MWPRSLNIKGQIYKVRYLDVVYCSDGESVMGTCDNEHKILEVKKQEDPLKQLQVLLHEMGHAVENELEIGAIRDSDSGPYEVHLLIEHISKEIVRNWDKFEKIPLKLNKSESK